MTNYIAYTHSPIGWIELQANDTCLCSACWIKCPPSENPGSTHPILQEAIWQLDEYFNGTRTEFDLPLRQEGTPFQQKVWEELRRIPYGTQISYQELAKRAGNPKAYRAAGSANGKNQIFIIIPCHRVVLSGGEIGGYAFGTEMKRFLLELEHKHLHR